MIISRLYPTLVVVRLHAELRPTLPRQSSPVWKTRLAISGVFPKFLGKASETELGRQRSVLREAMPDAEHYGKVDGGWARLRILNLYDRRKNQ